MSGAPQRGLRRLLEPLGQRRGAAQQVPAAPERGLHPLPQPHRQRREEPEQVLAVK